MPREGGAPRVLVDRPGIDNNPRFSPDGRHVAFISTGGQKLLKAARGLALVSVEEPRAQPIMLTGDTGTWVAEYTWAPDSRSIVYTFTEGTLAVGESMFESPLARVWLGNIGHGGEPKIELVTIGRSASFSPSISADGRLVAYRSVEHGTTGEVYVLDIVAGTEPRRLHERQPGGRATSRSATSSRSAGARSTAWRSGGCSLTPPGWDPTSGCRFSSTATAGRSAGSSTASFRSSHTSSGRSSRIRSRRSRAPGSRC